MAAPLRLCKPKARHDFVERVSNCYIKATGNQPSLYVTRASAGAETVYP